MSATAVPNVAAVATVGAEPPMRWVEAADLVRHAEWLPPTANTLIRVAGSTAALALMQQCPGVQFVVPKHPDANAAGAERWRQLAAIAGEAAMPAIAAEYAPGVLDVPTCRDLLLHKRNCWIRERFDALTARPAGDGRSLSAYAAAQAINLALAQAGWPMTLREVQKVINTAQQVRERGPEPQATLPGIPPPCSLDAA